MARIKAIQVDDKVWEEFKELSNKEGRKHGKLLEILIQKYKEDNDEDKN